MPAKTTATDYLEAGANPLLVRTQRRWLDVSFAVHLGMATALIGPSLNTVEQLQKKEIETKLVDPRWEIPKASSARPPEPVPSPKLALPSTKLPEMKPEVPASQRIAPDQVELGAPSFSIVDDRNQMDQVFARFQAVVAFSSKEDYGFYTSRFRAPDWHAEPIKGGIESAGLYCSFDIPGFPVPKRLCQEKNIPCESNAYAGFPKAQCNLISQDVKQFAGNRGYKRVQGVTVRFSATADSGFEVVDVTGSIAEPSPEGKNSQP